MVPKKTQSSLLWRPTIFDSQINSQTICKSIIHLSLFHLNKHYSICFRVIYSCFYQTTTEPNMHRDVLESLFQRQNNEILLPIWKLYGRTHTLCIIIFYEIANDCRYSEKTELNFCMVISLLETKLCQAFFYHFYCKCRYNSQIKFLTKFSFFFLDEVGAP